LGETFAIITPDDARAATGDARVEHKFQSTERYTRGQEDVTRVERHLLPAVQQRNLIAIVQRRSERGGVDQTW
jgi:hypothetical protein